MAVIAICNDPQRLLNDIKAGITKGSIETWQVDSDGDFTHSPTQWIRQAWLRPRVQQDRLVFSILGQKNTQMSKATYAVYHGRFIEMLLTHFDLQFSSVSASALPSLGDWVNQRINS
jgi:hypothetical protein